MESPTQVQHVTKASSDQLLRKFAEIDSDSDTDRISTSKRPRLSKKKKKKTNNVGDRNVLEEEEFSPSKENVNSNNNNINASFRMAERKSLLNNNSSNNNNNKRRSSGKLLKQIGISRSHLSRSCKHKSVVSAFQKTWGKAIKGASKIFMEKHYNRHRILNNNDIL